MGIGLVCHYIEKDFKKNGSFEWKNRLSCGNLTVSGLRAGKYSNEYLTDSYASNIITLTQYLPKIREIASCFRMSSEMIPLFDLVDKKTWDNDRIRSLYQTFGDEARRLGLRVVTHPGQFCVLSSLTEKTVLSAVKELEYHSWLFDAAGFDASPYYAINIHLGRKDGIDSFRDAVKLLSPSARSRLTVENCETAASVVELKSLYDAVGTPIVFDSHHHTFRTGGIDLEAAYELSLGTWNGVKPLQHVSNSEIGSENGNFADRRKHSEYLHSIPAVQAEALANDSIDLEFEAKMKNEAIKAWLNK